MKSQFTLKANKPFMKVFVLLLLVILLVPYSASAAYSKSYTQKIPEKTSCDTTVVVTALSKNAKVTFSDTVGSIFCKFRDNPTGRLGDLGRTHLYASYTLTVSDYQNGRWVPIMKKDIFNKKSETIKLPRKGQYQITVHVWKPTTIVQSYWNKNVTIALNFIDRLLTGKTFRSKKFNRLNNVTITNAYWRNHDRPTWTLSGNSNIGVVFMTGTTAK